MTNLLAITKLAMVALTTDLVDASCVGQISMTNSAYVGATNSTAKGWIAAETIDEIRLYEGGTMTRPIETVSVVTTTNDIPRWSPQTCHDGPSSWIMYTDEAIPGVVLTDESGKTNTVRFRFPTMTGPPPDDSERVRVVQTKRVARLTFDWGGKPREIVDEEILSETRTILKKQVTWIPEKKETP